MATRILTIIAVLALALLVSACLSPNPQPSGLTPVPTLAPAATLTLAPAIQGVHRCKADAGESMH